VVDHCKGIATVLEKGVVGETYNIGGWNEKANLEVVHTLCDLLTSSNPARMASRTKNKSPSLKIVQDTIDATRLTRPRFPMSSAGNRKRPLRPASVKRSSGTSTTRTGSLTCSRASTNTGSIKTIHEDPHHGRQRSGGACADARTNRA
jgi:hypothetical protein